MFSFSKMIPAQMIPLVNQVLKMFCCCSSYAAFGRMVPNRCQVLTSWVIAWLARVVSQTKREKRNCPVTPRRNYTIYS